MNENGEHFVLVLIAEMRKFDSQYTSLDDLLLAVRLLCTQYGHVNVFSEGPNRARETPLMVFSKVQLGALSRGEVQRAFDFLVELGADLRMVDDRGKNAVMHAAGGFNDPVCQIFYTRTKGCPRFWNFDWNAEDKTGCNVSGIAGQSCRDKIHCMRSQCSDMAYYGLFTLQELGGVPVRSTQAASSNDSAWHQPAWHVMCYHCKGHGHTSKVCPSKRWWNRN